MKYTLQHIASGNCIMDEQQFNSEEEMEAYIDRECLPVWEEGDSIVCNGTRRECFDDYSKEV
tara:strand:+ start:276 stop:461 length:186 start_codon:yes stop_codon:yes gene_type:complete